MSLRRSLTGRRDTRTTVLFFVQIATAIVAGCIVVAGPEIAAALRPSQTRPSTVDLVLAGQRDLRALDLQIKQLQSELQALRSTPDRTNLAAQIASLNVTLNDVAARQQRIEAAIVDDPARALEVPLLRRDLDNLVAQQLQQAEAQRRDVERLYQLLIGLVAALVVTVIAPALASAWSHRHGRREAPRSTSPDPANKLIGPA